MPQVQKYTKPSTRSRKYTSPEADFYSFFTKPKARKASIWSSPTYEPEQWLPQPKPTAKPSEFWESPELGDYFTKGTLPESRVTKPAPYEAPKLDVGALQEQAIAPLRREYKEAVGEMGSRLSFRKLGRSGAYVQAELDELYDYLTGIGGPTADIALRAEELAQRERISGRQERLSYEELASKERLEWAGLEKEWAKLGLSAQELADKKEMFLTGLQENQRQFNRTYSLQENQQMIDAKQEWARIGLSADEITENARQYDSMLLWQKEQFGYTFGWDQSKYMMEIGFRYDELMQTGELTREQITEQARQFDMNLWQQADFERERNRITEEQLRIDEAYKKGLIGIDEYRSRTDRLRTENDKMIADRQVEIDQQRTDILSNQIFGYWDTGFEPGSEDFPEEVYKKNEDGTIYYDSETGLPEFSDEYRDYMTMHYHRGQLDLAEWQIWVEMSLGMVGVISGGEEEEGFVPESKTRDNIINEYLPGQFDKYGVSPEIGDQIVTALEAGNYQQVYDLIDALGLDPHDKNQILESINAYIDAGGGG